MEGGRHHRRQAIHPSHAPYSMGFSKQHFLCRCSFTRLNFSLWLCSRAPWLQGCLAPSTWRRRFTNSRDHAKNPMQRPTSEMCPRRELSTTTALFVYNQPCFLPNPTHPLLLFYVPRTGIGSRSFFYIPCVPL